MALAEAKSLYRRAIRACRALPVRHIDAKLELNVKIAAHYLIRRERDGPSEELLQQAREGVRALEALHQQPRDVIQLMLRKNVTDIWKQPGDSQPAGTRA
ncbi:hypothetical protein FNF27_04514 [Cafeteria roenbergensis]|uniref:Uncharacterized protein n=1 Tax=Cafeteria roenbergensis TaxID=33653 RepID=A0A5A8D2V2_CAFRO|nr:hypothetical protein FNF29_06215 [Cafeteria roenbergensis]KAA0159488.1 hypothetical protein FNF28_05845 [Cafeteria roenbergensis]KAA0173953.1 hypothetical protein FNF27_04514 [Cafeteria roenbergensis]|eukprot:KAA0149127.1 hypothetical protein FNF29_06215 [Cafeteria roenbergensis]